MFIRAVSTALFAKVLLGNKLIIDTFESIHPVIMERILKIYRASAGSGKTFTLALEYMKLLIENPYSYKRILAVTFTNKATGEMKERILGKLYGVANRTPDAADYLKKLKEQLPGKSEEQIVANAEKALQLLLHDYGHFRIQTIDAFFQSVLRSLARELELNGDMEILLDGEKQLNDAVDTFIRNLEPDTTDIAQVVGYIEDELANGSEWRVDRKIKTFAQNLLKEEYQQRGEGLSEEIERDNGLLLKRFYNDVSSYKKHIIAKVKDIGNKFFLYAGNLSVSDFSGGKRGIWPMFEKMRDGNVINISESRAALVNTPEKISAKRSNNDDIALLIQEAIPLYKEYQNCELSLKHYHQLSMLNKIAKTLKEENTRENRFLLAETTFLLSTMISKNTTFIFEKIGTEIDHIFIDEFQDTSKLQWNCFKVLLEEVLARGNFNLIVGDVKQSIYRWRNSDWNIMNKITTFFRDDMTSFANQDVKIDGTIYKSTNYRSDRRIVEFNNALYRAAVESIKSTYEETVGKAGLKEIESAYEDVEQAVPQNKPQQGYAEIRVLKAEKENDKFTQRAIDELLKTFHRLFDEEHIPPGKITILMRTKKEKMQKVVDAFNLEFPNIKIVSDEAYKLCSSQTIQLVVAAMRYIATPDDNINILNMIKLYNKIILKQDNDLSGFTAENLLAHIPEEFKEQLNHLKGLPVYELIEQLLHILNVENAKSEQAYVYAFLDHASKYINSRCGDLVSFLDAWDESIYKESIPAECVDSVRVMTIHKSKGLEFHTVIVPLCDWSLTGDSKGMLWCEPTEAPYNTLSLLPIDCKKDMIESIYRKDYYNEYLYQIVDNLNLLYVATTRAKSNVILFADGISSKGNNISRLLEAIAPKLVHLPGSEYNQDDEIFTFGKIVSGAEKPKEKKDTDRKELNPFEQKPSITEQPFEFHKSKITFKQSRELARFLATDKEEKQYRNIAEGELMHLVMSGIRTKDDIPTVLNRLTIEGMIATGKEYDRIAGLVERAIANPLAKDWFNGKYKLYNECTILTSNGQAARRPDRVMIDGDNAVVVDYKFGHENDAYSDQVKLYVDLLQQMGYSNVEGYLWYVYKNDIKKV